MDKPLNIYNSSSTCYLLPINMSVFGFADKGNWDVHKVMSDEMSESDTANVCCYAEDNNSFPVCIFRGVNKKAECEDLQL